MDSGLLKTTRENVFVLSSKQGGPMGNSSLLQDSGKHELICFTNADFSSCQDTRKSQREQLFSFETPQFLQIRKAKPDRQEYDWALVLCFDGENHGFWVLPRRLSFLYQSIGKDFQRNGTPVFWKNTSAERIAVRKSFPKKQSKFVLRYW